MNTQIFIGNAEKCLAEAYKLEYAYFSPELDNFEKEVKVADVLFKVLREVDLLDGGELQENNETWNEKKARTWRKKASTFLQKWAEQSDEMQEVYRNI